MASPFDRLMNTIRPHVPGAIEEAVKQELFLVCDDFFNRSDAWREYVEVTQRAGEQTAEFMPFAGRVKRLMAVVDMEGRPVYGAYISAPGVLTFRSPANQETRLTAIMSLTVSDPISRDAYPIVPYELVEKYTAELISGILGRMMAQPSKPYTNLNLATFHTVQFRSGAARAKNETQTGHVHGGQNWRFPTAFRT